MLETIPLDRALCLPAVDVAALLQGKLVAAIPDAPVQKGWTFALYPVAELNSPLTIQQQYHSHGLPLAREIIAQERSATVVIDIWAKCAGYKMLYEVEQLDTLSKLTIWRKDLLKKELERRQHLFVAFLQVYRLPKSIQVSSDRVPCEKFRKFVSLPTFGEGFDKPIKVAQLLPVLSDSEFTQRKHQLEELRPPLHPELEELYSQIAQLSKSVPIAKLLATDIKTFLGWVDEYTEARQSDPDLAWIKTIAKVGNSSDGHEFEKLVRKSLIKLGFSNTLKNSRAGLDPEATGGAGGIDFYCNLPYQVVGECKATKSEKVPSKTPGQLLQLGKNHLQDDYEACVKLIVAAGELTPDAELTAVNHQMNVIRPDTLQRLTALKAKYSGAVDLFQLKRCLEESPFGEEADAKLSKHINELERQIGIRLNLIRATQKLSRIHSDQTQFEVAEIRIQYNNSFSQSDGGTLDKETVYQLLIELASPLVGCLGHIKASSLNSDRFYYLRDLNPDK